MYPGEGRLLELTPAHVSSTDGTAGMDGRRARRDARRSGRRQVIDPDEAAAGF